MKPLLEVQSLHVAYRPAAGGECPALADVSFEVRAGETLGVLGESGSGKSTLAVALLRLLPANGRVSGGAVQFEGQDLLKTGRRELEKIRGGRIGLMFQDPSMALHPAIRAGQQVSGVIGAHHSMDRAALRKKTLEVLARLFPKDAERIADSYPHQLSGGQRQRVLLAQATACDPALLIADEPTASLDASTQQEILGLFGTLKAHIGLALIFITHKPEVLAQIADRVLVLYAGRVAEVGPAASVLSAPRHPYTKALLQCAPSQAGAQLAFRKSKLPVIAGEPPNLMRLLHGCRFEPRCAERMDVCNASEPAQIVAGEGHAVSCFKYGGGS